jgi:hypothetical protein
MTPEECEAAWTVACLVSGRPEARDIPGAPDGTHDFDGLEGPLC